MEWDAKVKLVELGNKIQESSESRDQFEVYVLEQIESFDVQAIHMYLNIISLTKDDILKSIEFHRQVVGYIGKAKDKSLPLRESIRLELYQMLIENEEATNQD